MAGASKTIRLPKPVAYKKLLTAHTDACSLVPKLGEVKILKNSFSVDMLCITETWLKSDVTDFEVSLENYNISEETNRVADKEEASLSMLSLNSYHDVFTLISILIPPLQKLSRAKSPTHPNYSPFSEYTEAQPLRKLMANISSVPSALSPINRALVLSLEMLMLHTSIGRQARAQFQMVCQ